MGVSKKPKAVAVARKAEEVEISDQLEIESSSTDNFSSSDDSEDEVVLNRAGKVPGHWYEEPEHRGYDVFGKKVQKMLSSSKIDELLKNAEDPDRWRTIQDFDNEREVLLTDGDIEIIKRLRAGKYTDASVTDEGYFVEYDDAPHKLHPVRHRDLAKSRFLPSKDESKEIRRLVKLIRAGKLVPGQSKSQTSFPGVFDIWVSADEHSIRGPAPLPAPKMALPGHAESYRPPEEYLFNEAETKEWEAGDDSTRQSTFVPEEFPALRRVPFYSRFITERFSRCLDLYTVPRMLKKKMNIDPDSLIPQLPKITDLRPFPTTLSVEFVGHENPVTSVSPSPRSGEWVASASSDSVRVWDTLTGKCLWILDYLPNGGEPVCLAWHPNPVVPILAVGDSEGYVHFVLVSDLVLAPQAEVAEVMTVDASLTGWVLEERKTEKILTLAYGCTTPITSVAWHHKGNFLAAVSATSPSREKSCCVVSALTKKFVSPLKGKGQSTGGAKHVIFHPLKPYLVVAGTSHIAIFDLKSQTRVKTLNSNSNTLSSVAVHPSGDGMHVVASSLDNKVIWFDSEVRDKPWKNFRHHTAAVRKVSIHPRAGANLPLMASAGDDKAVHVLHARVYVEDSSKNPLVIPTKKLNHPSQVSDCQWHPSLPWLFTACADGIVRLWA